MTRHTIDLPSINSGIFQILELEINTDCNLKCSYCPNSRNPNTAAKKMSQSTFDRIIAQLVEINYEGNITFEFYNEPMLCETIDQFSQQITRQLPECNIVLYTNGTLLTYERFVQLLDAGIDYFIVTKHENITKIPFDDVFPKLDEVMKKRVRYTHFTNIKKTNRAGNLEGDDFGKAQMLTPCYIPSFIATVSYDGKLISCFEDYHKSHIMGDIHVHRIDHIWNSPEYKSFRSKLKSCLRHLYPLCSKCSRGISLPEHFLIK